MINSSVLVLNRSFFPVNLTTVKHAFCMLYSGAAKAVDSQYQTFDYESWSQVAIEQRDEAIGLVNKLIKIPRVIMLVAYDRIPKTQVRFTRANIFARDNNTCQYCRKTFPKNELSIDHVIPRSYGGKSTWENVVCSCFTCNRTKGGRTPKQAHMKLSVQPRKPRWTPLNRVSLNGIKRQEWAPFLNVIDVSYWNTELTA
jgi:5-methylcytosine-specific restriction endonuclease McrA